MFIDVTLQPRKVEEPKPEEVVSKQQYNWLYENSINSGKERLIIEEQEEKYSQWRTNSSLSNFRDTIMNANEMNINPHITDQMHYDFLFYNTRKAKRYGKKKTEEDKRLEKQLKQEIETINLISDYYKYNIAKSKEAMKVLTKNQIDLIKKKLDKGGVK